MYCIKKDPEALASGSFYDVIVTVSQRSLCFAGGSLAAVRATAGTAAVAVTAAMASATATAGALRFVIFGKRTGFAAQVLLRHGEHEFDAV